MDEAVDDERDNGCETASELYAHEYEGALVVESREDERAMSNDVAGGEMFEYGEVKNGGRLYFDILCGEVWTIWMR